MTSTASNNGITALVASALGLGAVALSILYKPEAKKKQKKRPVLGYWRIRGLAQPIRLMLAHTRTEYGESSRSYSLTVQSLLRRGQAL